MRVRVARSCVIDAPAGEVWRLLRDFNAHAEWHPAVASSLIEAGEPPDLVGAVRAFRLNDGGFLREQLIALSDRDMSLTYCLLEAPLRLQNYVASLRLRRVTDGERTVLHWQSGFDAAPAEAEPLARIVGETIYEGGMAALRRRFARGSRPPVAIAVPSVSMPPRPVPSGTALEAMAIVIDRHGGPEVLVARRVVVPAPSLGEIRLRHLAIGVNMVDIHGRAGDFGLEALPATPGMEAAGMVIDMGQGVGPLSPGDRVVYACPPPGAYAEVRTMPAAMVLRLPADIDPEAAAATFLKGIMADLLLHDVHRLQPGETVLVHAAAGGLGLILCRWARAMGARVIGLVSNEAKAAAAAEAGCTPIIVTAPDRTPAAVLDLTEGRGVDVVYDGIGLTSFDASLACLGRRGHLVSYGQVSGPVGRRDLDDWVSKSIRLSRPNFGHFIETREALENRAARLFEAMRQGIVRSRIDRRYPLHEAAKAHERLQTRQNIGSVILMPQGSR